MEKMDYIKQLKILIKKSHPDLCEDEYLENIYNEITIKLNNILDSIKNKNKINENIGIKNNCMVYKINWKFIGKCKNHRITGL
jgi:homoaconitase/3-isopropylmalate dehydratase large subunit